MRVEILQGLPGSGKSTYANSRGCVFFSADLFHVGEDGIYRFDPKNSGVAHSSCLNKFIEYARSRCHSGDLVIVDNTNCRAHEVAPYMAVAAAYNVEAEIIYFPCSVEDSVKRNVHGVPFGTIWEMNRALMTESFPPYWKRRIQS